MADNKILTAVRGLDPDNANHWTADGQPRIETVKMLAGDPSLTRDAISAAAPDLTRDNAKDYVHPDEQPGMTAPGGGVGDTQTATTPPEGSDPQAAPQAPTQQDAPTAPPPVPVGAAPGLNADGRSSDGSEEPSKPEGELDLSDKHASEDTTEPPVASGDPTKVDAASLGDQGPREAGLGDARVNVATQAELVALDRGVSGDADDVADMEEDLARAVARTAEMRAAVDEATAGLAESMAEESRLTAAIEAVRPRTGTMEAIQSFFATQDADGQKTVEARKAISDSGLNLKELNKLVKPSPLDQAMASQK